MKYFTPELYVQGNSDDDDAVDYVEKEWERRIKRYRRHYKKIEAQLPPMLRKFDVEQCLHDADVFAPALLPANAPWNGPELVIVAQQINTVFPEYVNTLAILQYDITAPPVVEVPVESPVFYKEQPIWLYEEVDVVEPGVFSHEILISDGRVIKVLFRNFKYHIAPLCLPGKTTPAPAPRKKMASA
jgi:hypothetical protein